MHGIDWVDVGLSGLKIAIVLGAMLNVTPIMVWVERRGSAFINGFGRESLAQRNGRGWRLIFPGNTFTRKLSTMTLGAR